MTGREMAGAMISAHCRANRHADCVTAKLGDLCGCPRHRGAPSPGANVPPCWGYTHAPGDDAGERISEPCRAGLHAECLAAAPLGSCACPAHRAAAAPCWGSPGGAGTHAGEPWISGACQTGEHALCVAAATAGCRCPAHVPVQPGEVAAPCAGTGFASRERRRPQYDTPAVAGWTAAEHYREAGLLLTGDACPHGCPFTGCEHEAATLARAQAHATAAVAERLAELLDRLPWPKP